MQQQDLAKKAAGEKATEFIKPNMTIGLGTGSTAYYAIMRIGEMVSSGIPLRAVATSEQSEQLARKQGIPIIPFSDVEKIDLDIDGADEVDEHLRLIKGGGGALLREKIVAAASAEMIVVTDESKLVKHLGRFPLPVEIIPFAWELTFRRLIALDAMPVLRTNNGRTVVTDNGNYILDCHYERIKDPVALHQQLNDIPGVVENGLFLHYASRVIIGYADGSVKSLSR
ncbi:ribose-5-phosphate isomerase RpiA [Chitinophaga qingshengii]|uniref:Ribose-5-phosphate isomerase A n=1 Tax=Chitinophaga qingshengii TaxID=1569794 RepID=A0ABR7TV12_9BACT|nr:ribose-5-phosphate isomerase RpiA [Chitinophaga qingshengii]MBC9934326.1 ribose-5-phosphate isomerase RpiA [Chitinophaga qingshengii]